LSGLVGITAGCGSFQPWAAFIVGILSGIIYKYSNKMVLKFEIDDPLHVSGIHLFCGIWGCIAVGIFDEVT
jgi:Amt family ammonium transporter